MVHRCTDREGTQFLNGGTGIPQVSGGVHPDVGVPGWYALHSIGPWWQGWGQGAKTEGREPGIGVTSTTPLTRPSPPGKICARAAQNNWNDLGGGV